MSDVYNPEAEIQGRIESLELEARDLRRREEAAASDQDRRVLQKQRREIEAQIDHLRRRLHA